MGSLVSRQTGEVFCPAVSQRPSLPIVPQDFEVRRRTAACTVAGAAGELIIGVGHQRRLRRHSGQMRRQLCVLHRIRHIFQSGSVKCAGDDGDFLRGHTGLLCFRNDTAHIRLPQLIVRIVCRKFPNGCAVCLHCCQKIRFILILLELVLPEHVRFLPRHTLYLPVHRLRRHIGRGRGFGRLRQHTGSRQVAEPHRNAVRHCPAHCLIFRRELRKGPEHRLHRRFCGVRQQRCRHGGLHAAKRCDPLVPVRRSLNENGFRLDTLQKREDICSTRRRKVPDSKIYCHYPFCSLQAA